MANGPMTWSTEILLRSKGILFKLCIWDPLGDTELGHHLDDYELMTPRIT